MVGRADILAVSLCRLASGAAVRALQGLNRVDQGHRKPIDSFVYPVMQ